MLSLRLDPKTSHPAIASPGDHRKQKRLAPVGGHRHWRGPEGSGKPVKGFGSLTLEAQVPM